MYINSVIGYCNQSYNPHHQDDWSNWFEIGVNVNLILVTSTGIKRNVNRSCRSRIWRDMKVSCLFRTAIYMPAILQR